MADVSERVKERLKVLSKKFTQQLPQRLAHIKEVYEQALFTTGGSKEFEEFRMLVHKLSGSGSTFGYHTLSTEANKLEDLLDNINKNERSISPEVGETIKGHLKKLETECSKHTGSAITEKRVTDISAASNDEMYKTRTVCFFNKDKHGTLDFSEQLGFFGFPIRNISSVAEIKEMLDKTIQVILILDAGCLEAEKSLQQALMGLKEEHPLHVHIIFISEKDDFETRLQTIRAGGDAFFTEPVDVSRIIDKIDNLTFRLDHEPYHVLIVDDDKEQVSFHALILQQAGMITSVASDPKNVFQVLIESKPELVLMDMYMPGASGIELAQLIRQQEAYVGIPIVFLSIETDVEKQLEAISHGGDDFLVKPIDPQHLIKSVTIRAERTRNMRFFMERDSLTGLLNHSNLIESLNTEVQRAERIGNDLCFAMIDIDHFKSVNDSYGHLTGDRVLKGLARLLQERLRKTDIIGRYGGEEFGVILFNTDEGDAGRILDEIRESFSKIRQYSGSNEFFVTFSCGIAALSKCKDAGSLNHEADKALYEAKEEGRNRIVKG